MRPAIVVGLLVALLTVGCGAHHASAADNQACGLVATDAATGLSAIESALKAGDADELASFSSQASTKIQNDVASLDQSDPVRVASYTLAAGFTTAGTDFAAGNAQAGLKAIAGQRANHAYENACRPTG